MPENFEHFYELPQEIQQEITQYLPNSSLLNLALASKGKFPFFKQLLGAREFLRYVARGQYAKVIEMLEKNSHLLTQKGQVIDCSERTFSNISGFQYALWAMDKYMWDKMIDNLLVNNKFKDQALVLHTQYKEVKEFGVTYTFRGIVITESHFDFQQTIIKELQTQADYMKLSYDGDIKEKERDNHWKKNVGDMLYLLPMHAVYEYCSEKPFKGNVQFTQQPSSFSTRVFTGVVVNGEDQTEEWFTLLKNPNRTHAISKAGRKGAYAKERGVADATDDLAAMNTLFITRTGDFQQLEQKLCLEYSNSIDCKCP
ncbi:hypothetical protein [Legionella brunensis]|uniref:F-box domain-containing protein n=1 Tax=Legionella brunensis TaxID=29422 RepID=A0A0W0SVB6_9GAMM|nr:hypothetical protein [Legionella brunensis]KTC87203.1 hypothetical protein Lbru_0021 [Legionella brunensis]